MPGENETTPSHIILALITPINPNPQEIHRPPSKAMAELGWQPTTTFKDGIKLTVKWYQEHKDWLDECTSGEYLKYYDKMYGKR